MVGQLVIPEAEGEDSCSLDIWFHIPTNNGGLHCNSCEKNLHFSKENQGCTRERFAGVIIYDHLFPERESFILIHKDADDSPDIMMNSLKQKHHLCLIWHGSQKTVQIRVRAIQCPLNIYLCGFFTVRIIVAYALFYCSSEQIMIKHEQRAQMVKSELQKDVHSLELRKLNKDEFDLAEDTY